MKVNFLHKVPLKTSLLNPKGADKTDEKGALTSYMNTAGVHRRINDAFENRKETTESLSSGLPGLGNGGHNISR